MVESSAEPASRKETWHGFLLDGHNRFDICQRRKLPFDVIDVALASRDHALLWIEENLARRHLSDCV